MDQSQASDDFKRLLTVEQAAEYLSCSEANLYALIEAGDLPYVRVGRRKGYRIDRQDLDAFIESRKQQKSDAAPLKPVMRHRLKHIRLS